MNSIEWLKGKKTIGTAVIALAYLFGCWLGWFEFDSKVVAALGFSGLAFLRLGLKTTVQLLMLCLGLLWLTGCASVPATVVTFNQQSGTVSVKSPKDITITNLVATVENGHPKVTVGYYSSKNSPDVIASVAAANAQMAQILGQLAIQGMGQAAGVALKP